MDYKILTASAAGSDPADAASVLTAKVKSYLAQGWKLQGGVSLGPPDSASDFPFVYLMQAVTKD